jgi:NAD(P)-dependent dehydrogenase (short-subunit alcohol dehydrogenase family)
MQHYSRKTPSCRDYPEFESKTVLILGGANGIGAALVEAFLSLGAKVGIVDKDVTRINPTVKSDGAYYV